MSAKTSIDKAGRLVLPKPVRDRLRLQPGDELLVDDNEDLITLRPVRASVTLKKEHGIWVYQGDRSDASIPELVDELRTARLRDLAE